MHNKKYAIMADKKKRKFVTPKIEVMDLQSTATILTGSNIMTDDLYHVENLNWTANKSSSGASSVE